MTNQLRWWAFRHLVRPRLGGARPLIFEDYIDLGNQTVLIQIVVCAGPVQSEATDHRR